MMMRHATKRASITSAYLVPDESIPLAILTTAARGVLVELFVSEIGDPAIAYHAQRSYHEPRWRAGVRIYVYRAPKVLHAKHFFIDDEVAIIGTSNMDMRPFSLNSGDLGVATRFGAAVHADGGPGRIPGRLP